MHSSDGLQLHRGSFELFNNLSSNAQLVLPLLERDHIPIDQDQATGLSAWYVAPFI